jgi:hypothetical protein
MEIFKDYVYLGRTATDYINLIENIKRRQSRENTRAYRFCYSSHTWENKKKNIRCSAIKLRIKSYGIKYQQPMVSIVSVITISP